MTAHVQVNVKEKTTSAQPHVCWPCPVRRYGYHAPGMWVEALLLKLCIHSRYRMILLLSAFLDG